jgi:hypothetical protein
VDVVIATYIRLGLHIRAQRDSPLASHLVADASRKWRAYSIVGSAQPGLYCLSNFGKGSARGRREESSDVEGL